jgi:UDP-N-acetylglucosamine 4,6-dehydratase (inverting)
MKTTSKNNFFRGKSILITGGTGSLGKALTRYFLKNHPEIDRLIIFSRDEQKQFLMSQEFSVNEHPSIRYFIGDVRDQNRLMRAFNGVDFVIHCAAMKHVHIAEYNPEECIKTNINGAKNIINAALKSDVKKVVSLSTDKASSPTNLYGATKLTSDKLFVSANNIKGKKDINFSVVRYGNVMGSNGSVIPFFLKLKDEGRPLTITDPNMTRFNILLNQGVDLIIFALLNSFGGEIYVPKIPSYNVFDLAEAIDPGAEKKIIGMRPGEKIHEEMISSIDSLNTIDIGDYFIILPDSNKKNKDLITKKFGTKFIEKGFCYNSLQNENKLSVGDLKELIKSYDFR